MVNRAQVRSIFDDFFNSYTTVAKQLTAPGVTIHVSELPAGKPAGFDGSVGQYTISSKISNTELAVNEAVTLTITIQGSGNMKLVKTNRLFDFADERCIWRDIGNRICRKYVRLF